jgi:hypothetical protein
MVVSVADNLDAPGVVQITFMAQESQLAKGDNVDFDDALDVAMWLLRSQYKLLREGHILHQQIKEKVKEEVLPQKSKTAFDAIQKIKNDALKAVEKNAPTFKQIESSDELFKKMTGEDLT